MNKIIIAIIVLIVISVVGAAIYLIASFSYFNERSGSVQLPASSVPESTEITISMKNFSFNPAMQTIKTGTKVTWVNDDSAPHDVVSDSSGIFASPVLSKGQSFSFTFTDSGSVSYHCGIHPSMKGTIIVED